MGQLLPNPPQPQFNAELVLAACQHAGHTAWIRRADLVSAYATVKGIRIGYGVKIWHGVAADSSAELCDLPEVFTPVIIALIARTKIPKGLDIKPLSCNDTVRFTAKARLDKPLIVADRLEELVEYTANFKYGLAEAMTGWFLKFLGNNEPDDSETPPRPFLGDDEPDDPETPPRAS